MGGQLFLATRLFLLTQQRARFPQIYFGVAVLTVAAFRAFLVEDTIITLLPVFLLGEPGTLGFVLVAAHVYLERNEKSVVALCVTPLKGWVYVAAVVVASAVVATGAGVVVQAGSIGFDGRLGLLVPVLFLSATLFGFIGFAIAGYFSEFTRFLLGAGPIGLLILLPLLSYFELASRWSYAWMPSDAALYGFATLVQHPSVSGDYLLYAGLLLVYNVVAFRWAVAVYHSRMRTRLEQ